MVLLRHLQPSRTRASFIVYFDHLLGTLSGWGGGVTVVINQDDLSAAWPRFLTAVLLSLPVSPSAENSRYADCAGNPSVTDLYWKVPCFPTFVSILYHDIIIFRSFSFIGFPASFFELSTR